MTEEQRKHLERRLHEERERVLGSLARYAERSSTSEQEQDGELSAYPFHLADEGTDTFEQELSASLASRQTLELEEITDALRRFYEEPERFGRDERTGEEIPFERLDIIPWARTRG